MQSKQKVKIKIPGGFELTCQTVSHFPDIILIIFKYLKFVINKLKLACFNHIDLNDCTNVQDNLIVLLRPTLPYVCEYLF